MSAVSIRIVTVVAAAALLAGCKVGPDYQRVPIASPAAFKETPPGWKIADPADAQPKGAWWSVFKDPVLDGLEQQVAISNQTVKEYEAAYRQSLAIVREAQADLFPVLGITPSVTRSSSGVTSSTRALTGLSGSRTSTTYQIEGNASWDLDLWGKIRRQVESDAAAAQASAADIANARLSAQASLASDYFQLRSSDSLAKLLTRTVADYQRSVTITQNQYDAGVAARSDVITAQTQLAGAQAQLVNVGVARAQYEHAIALLIGRAPADLTIEPGELAQDVPVVPVTVPARLLERRPDIASAERTMADRNAQIGVAVAAYYPDVSLSGAFGYSGDPLRSLISSANRLWSLGATLTQTVFEGGLRGAQVDAARAAFDQSVAAYRMAVLTAFQGVEDQLSSLRILADEAKVQDEAVALARRAVEISLNEYRAGTQAYTAVVTAQATALSDEENALTIRQNRLVAAVNLITDLGGGWATSDLPGDDTVRKNVFLPF